MNLRYVFTMLPVFILLFHVGAAGQTTTIDFQASSLSNGSLGSYSNPTSRGTALKNAYPIISNFGGEAHSQAYGQWPNSGTLTFPATGGLTLGSSANSRSLMFEHPRDYMEFGPFPNGISAYQVIFTLRAYTSNTYARGCVRVTVLDASKQGVGVDSSGVFFEVSTNAYSTSNPTELCIFPNAIPAGGYVRMRRSSLYGNATFAWPNGNFYMDDISFTPNPVPVELVAFRALLKSGTVDLYWRTATELNNYGFEVQRSADKRAWDVLGFVEGNGNSFSPKEYRFVDEAPLRTTDKVYYRLKQIDRDGTSETTSAVSVDMHGAVLDFTLSAHPLPFGETLTLTVEARGEQWASIALYNSALQKIDVVYEGMVSGSTAIPLTTSHLQDGNYFLIVQRDGHAPEIQRLVKLTP